MNTDPTTHDAEEHIFWLQAVHALLRCQYERSRRKHVVSFLETGVAFPDSQLDGHGGSVLLTELHYHLGKEVIIRRNFFKRLVLISARSLGWPLQSTPSGSVTLGFRPRQRAMSDAHLKRILTQLSLPTTVLDRVLLPFLGDAWWGRRSASALPDASHLASYALLPRSSHALLRSIFCFRCTEISFSSGSHVVGEWQGRNARLSLRASDIWRFIVFLRHERQRTRECCRIIEVGGLGDVLV
jgi:hypothetical protein